MNNQHIFFSYSREDTDFVLRLAKDLRAAGENIWLDQLDIEPGKRWDKEIETALKNARKLLLVLSPTSVASDNVMDEVSYALEENRKVIPILYQPCEIPFRLRRLQYVDFSEDYQSGFQRLLEYLHAKEPEIKAAVTQPLKKAPAPRTAAQSKSGFPKWAMGLIAVAVIALIAFFLRPKKSNETNKEAAATEEVMEATRETAATLSMPRLTSQSLETATRQIQRLGLRLGKVEKMENDNYPDNTVIRQKPEPGLKVVEGAVVNLAVSMKPAMVSVVNVVGQQKEAGIRALQSIGLKPNIRREYSDCSKKPGTIMAQKPSAGTSLKKGAEVEIDLIAPRKQIKALPIPQGREKLRILRNGQKTAENAWALKNTNVVFSLEGDECTKGEVVIKHPLGGTDTYNLKAGERQSGSRFFGAGQLVVYFRSNNPEAKLHLRIW